MNHELISPQALNAQQAKAQREDGEQPFIIDVRSAEEYAAGHIAGAVHIPGDELADRLDELPQDRPVVPY